MLSCLGLSLLYSCPGTHKSPKLNAVKNLGASIELVGDSFFEAWSTAVEHAKEVKAPFIEAFNDNLIIAGQGTVGLEIVQSAPSMPDYIFVPVGGGGLISGIAIIIKKLWPTVKIIGVEPVDSNAMTRSIAEKNIHQLDYVNSFADGVAMKAVGHLNFAYCRMFVDDYINVTTDEICFATKAIYEDLKIIAEPAGALSLAGLLAYAKEHKLKNKKLITINSGSNMDFDRLQFVAQHAKIGAGSERLFVINLQEKPGTLRLFCNQALAGLKVSEFNYRLDDPNTAVIFLGLQAKTKEDQKLALTRLKNSHYEYYEMTNDDLAKYHLRYMVPGYNRQLGNERVFQFTLPQSGDGFYSFLHQITTNWNISLLHYRDYGDDYSKMFIGLQCFDEQKEGLSAFIAGLNYQFQEVTDHPGYKMLFRNS